MQFARVIGSYIHIQFQNLKRTENLRDLLSVGKVILKSILTVLDLGPSGSAEVQWRALLDSATNPSYAASRKRSSIEGIATARQFCNTWVVSSVQDSKHVRSESKTRSLA